jgi:hypothetical protein
VLADGGYELVDGVGQVDGCHDEARVWLVVRHEKKDPYANVSRCIACEGRRWAATTTFVKQHFAYQHVKREIGLDIDDQR